MEKMCQLRKSICMGRLIWIQALETNGSILRAKKYLKRFGFESDEVPYLSAKEFVFCYKFGLLLQVSMKSRMLLIGEIDNLDKEMRLELGICLANSRRIKMQYDLNIAVILPKNQENELINPLKPYVLPDLEGGLKLEANEVIHNCIEDACALYGRSIRKISTETANLLEMITISEGAEFVKGIIFQSFKKNKESELDCESILKIIQNNKLDPVDTFVI